MTSQTTNHEFEYWWCMRCHTGVSEELMDEIYFANAEHRCPACESPELLRLKARLKKTEDANKND